MFTVWYDVKSSDIVSSGISSPLRTLLDLCLLHVRVHTFADTNTRVWRGISLAVSDAIIINALFVASLSATSAMPSRDDAQKLFIQAVLSRRYLSKKLTELLVGRCIAAVRGRLCSGCPFRLTIQAAHIWRYQLRMIP